MSLYGAMCWVGGWDLSSCRRDPWVQWMVAKWFTNIQTTTACISAFRMWLSLLAVSVVETVSSMVDRQISVWNIWSLVFHCVR